MTEDELFKATEDQAKLGTNFMAIHTGINNITMDRLKAHAGTVASVPVVAPL